MKQLEGEVCFLQTESLKLQSALDQQAAELTAVQIDLASIKEKNMDLGKENQVKRQLGWGEGGKERRPEKEERGREDKD